MGKITLQTIADRVGVSRTTVSNAFSRPDQLSDELRTRIHEVAQELGYGGPDPLARSLRSGRAGAIGVLMYSTLGHALRDPYAGEFLSGVADGMGSADTGMLLLPMPPGETDCTAVRNAVVDGFIVAALADGHPALDVVRSRDLPVVTVDSPRIEGIPFVSADDRPAGRELGNRLFGLGHRDVLLLTFALSPDGHAGEVDDERLAGATFRVSRERVHGLLEAAADAGVPRARITVHELAGHRPGSARDVVVAALRSSRPPTAIVCLSDQFALDALEVAEDLGLEVPGDVSVTGYDDIPAARVAQLTTIRQHTADKGRRALQLLDQRDGPQDVVVPHELVERRTLGPAPTAPPAVGS